jgi:hypothetical protein
LLDSWLAIDVTIPPLPPSFGASPTAATASTTQHHKAERTKFEINGTCTSVQVFEDLVKEQILLLPFTIDHLGGIVGTFAYCLLFGSDENKAPKPTTTASFYTTWPMAKMPPLTFSNEPMKIGLILTRTHNLVHHTAHSH